MSQEELPLNIEKAKPSDQPKLVFPGEIRVNRPVRNQIEMMLRDLESLLPEDHTVRAIWEFLQGLDVSAFYSSIKVVLDVPGRPASDPQVL
jgi:hypothetical protein